MRWKVCGFKPSFFHCKAATRGTAVRDSVKDAVVAAREFLGDPDAKATFWQCPPVGYARVKLPEGKEVEKRYTW